MPSNEDASAEIQQVVLARQFAAGDIPADAFERDYLRARTTTWEDTGGLLADVVDRIGFAVDDYVASDSLRDAARGDIDEHQLREIVQAQLRRLDPT
jgi:hypothetical protein